MLEGLDETQESTDRHRRGMRRLKRARQECVVTADPTGELEADDDDEAGHHHHHGHHERRSEYAWKSTNESSSTAG